MDVKQAGSIIDRSAATISRLENGLIPLPRRLDVLALLNEYQKRSPDPLGAELRDTLLGLVDVGRRKAWYDPFRDLVTGEMISSHILTLMEYEADASEIRTYEADVVPGLLQTRDYALAIAELHFPGRETKQYERWTEFRMARQQVLKDKGDIELTFVINEVALRRRMDDIAACRAQLLWLIDAVGGERYDIRVVRSSVTLPATLGGPFVLFTLAADPGASELVYLENRTGGNYLSGLPDIERYNSYFASLLEVALVGDAVVALLESIIAEIDGSE